MPPYLKVVSGGCRQKYVVVDEWHKMPDVLNAVYRGYLIPSFECDEKVKVIVKVSSCAAVDQEVEQEAALLKEVEALPGFPRVIEEGRIPFARMGADWQIRVDQVPFFVMPQIEGRDLTDKRLPAWNSNFPSKESIARVLERYLAPLAERIAGLHDHNIIHRDVKPNNVIVTEGDEEVVLLDFGSANHLYGSVPRVDQGTLGYFPPERIEPGRAVEDVRDDVYGFGAACFHMLSGSNMVVYEGMLDPSTLRGIDYMCFSRETVTRQYLEGISRRREAPFQRILEELNMPAELRYTNLGKYMARLFHPKKEERPANMHQVADEIRRLSGQFATLTIWPLHTDEIEYSI